jgi:predicted phosphodiesterase
MKIGVISDTHVSASGRRVLPPRLWQDFDGAELILHAGDLTSPRVVSELETIAPVLAITGNNDAPELNLPIFRRLELEGVVVGMAHGDRFARAASTSGTSGTLEGAAPARAFVPPSLPFAGNGQTSAFALSHVPDAQVMIFGHSHRPLLAHYSIGDRKGSERQVLLLNPGSPTDKRWSANWGVAILEVRDGEAQARAILW